MPDETPKYALSIREPWATLIIDHDKRIENRTWTPPEKVRGERFAIQASKQLDDKAMTVVHHPDDPQEWWVSPDIGELIVKAVENAGGADEFRESLRPGSILGDARLLGVVRDKMGHLDAYTPSDEADMYANIPQWAPMDMAGGISPYEVAETIGNGGGEWPWWDGKSKAWCLGDVRSVEAPIPAKGALRFWTIEVFERDKLRERVEV